MEHLLDYDILKEWGFEWIEKSTDGYGRIFVSSYIIKEPTNTDMFNFQSILLTMVPSLNTNFKWEISVLREKGKNYTLFEGNIYCKTNLKIILKSVLIFKPSNK